MPDPESFFLKKEDVIDIFQNNCAVLGINREHAIDISDLVIYEMIDGTRTSSATKGIDAYVDGGLFCLRLIDICNKLGIKYMYINVLHLLHKNRANYKDIYHGLLEMSSIIKEMVDIIKVKFKFIGDLSQPIEPEGLSVEYNLINELKTIENITENHSGLTVYFLINYSAKKINTISLKRLPQIDVIIRHTKGYINGDMWLNGKMDYYSFVYVQNGSISSNWTDHQIIKMISISFLSKLQNIGSHYLKDYDQMDSQELRQKREIDLYFKRLKLSEHPTKRIIIFNINGPEVYEF